VTEPTNGDLIYTDAKFPHGLRCIDCDHLFEEGERYSDRLIWMAEFRGEPASVCEVICVPCALKGAVT